MQNIFLYLLYTLVSTYGLYLIKISSTGFNFFFVLGFLFYGSCFVLWLYILKHNNLGIAFPIASSLLIIGTQFVGIFLLNENVSLTRL